MATVVPGISTVPLVPTMTFEVSTLAAATVEVSTPSLELPAICLDWSSATLDLPTICLDWGSTTLDLPTVCRDLTTTCWDLGMSLTTLPTMIVMGCLSKSRCCSSNQRRRDSYRNATRIHFSS